jgi:fatty acid desaturase
MPECAPSPTSASGGFTEPKKSWKQQVDFDAFKKDIDELGSQLRKGQGQADVDHLERMIFWQRSCFWVGYLSCWYSVNPISVLLVMLGISSRWMMIGHHVCHGGYDSLKKGTQYHRRKFALGLWRRCVDWLDWMLPEAWNCEHNQYHHYQLGEVGDPDLVEANLWWVRQLDVPNAFKYAFVSVFVFTWKWFYYAPNTFKELKIAQGRGGTVDKMIEHRNGRPEMMTVMSAFTTPAHMKYLAEILFVVLLPFFVWYFVLMPMPFRILLGTEAYKVAICNLVLAELLTNAHSFLVVVTNHAGDDVYRFGTTVKPRTGEFYVRQIVGSVNFWTGGDLNDFLHCWLNYQIEHHLWPDLSMLSYQKAAPLVRSICKKHNVPYLQQNVFARLIKTVDIMVGNTNMLVWEDI